MSRTHSLRSFLVLVLAACLVSGCGRGGADQEATAAPEPIPATALTRRGRTRSDHTNRPPRNTGRNILLGH